MCVSREHCVSRYLGKCLEAQRKNGKAVCWACYSVRVMSTCSVRVMSVSCCWARCSISCCWARCSVNIMRVSCCWARCSVNIMNENLYIAHKKLPHKTLRVHSAIMRVSCCWAHCSVHVMCVSCCWALAVSVS